MSAAGGPSRVLVLVLIATLAVRLAAASLIHLTEDEAYYRLWAMEPALGYYDHPPMIAWWIWIGRQLAGDTSLGVRLLPILASAATSLLLVDMARLAGAGRETATRAAIWYNAMVLVAAGAILAVPDAPAALFWSLTLWNCLKAVSGGHSGRWWIAAGVAAGLAALSKYSALFLAPGVLIWLVWSPTARRHLASPWPWLAALIAAAIFGLNVGWNATHHWLTFIKQFGRIAPTHFAPTHLATFLGAQFLLINPPIALFLFRALTHRSLRERLTPFIATSAPFIAYLTVHSLHDSVQAHWPAPVYPAIALCAALAAGETVGGGRWATLRRAVPWFGFAIYPLFAIVLVLPGRWTAPLTGPVQGWPNFSRSVDAVRLREHAHWVGTLSYGLAAQLGDEPSLRAPILQITERDRYLDLGPAKADMTQPGLVLDLARRTDIALLRRCFFTVEPLGDMKRVDPTPPSKTYAVFLVAGPRRDVTREGCLPRG